MFLFPRLLHLVTISAILDHIWGSKGPITSQKGPFRGCWIGTQNFTTTSAILMKLTTIMHLHESVSRKTLRTTNSVLDLVSRNFYTALKTVTYVMHYLALHHWQSFCTSWATFVVMLTYCYVNFYEILRTWVTKTFFFFILDIYYPALKIVTYILSYASLVKSLLKVSSLRLI